MEIQTAAPAAVLSDVSRTLPLRNLLGLEIFTDPADAEARYNHWLRMGQKNVWLHLVRGASLEDMREPLTVNLPLHTPAGTHLYILVRVS